MLQYYDKIYDNFQKKHSQQVAVHSVGKNIHKTYKLKHNYII